MDINCIITNKENDNFNPIIVLFLTHMPNRNDVPIRVFQSYYSLISNLVV